VYDLVHSLEGWDYWCKRSPGEKLIQLPGKPLGGNSRGSGKSASIYFKTFGGKWCGGVDETVEKWEHDRCPRCGELEDNAHITQRKGRRHLSSLGWGSAMHTAVDGKRKN